jgi:hypothetical protein
VSAKSVEIEAIRTEAKKWGKIADAMSDISTDVKNLDLEFTAFLLPVLGIYAIGGAVDAAVMHSAYGDFYDQLKHLAHDAVTEFERTRKALNRIADAYEQNEDMTTKNFNDFYAN